MDLIDGDTLEELVVSGEPLGISRACSLLRQTANGLYEAHQAGMIHRDLKPENLMVERLPAGDDFVHILDFGIVRLTDDASVSMTHGFIGTPLYASPEQAMAKDIDHRCDIYSLGAILFFMLTGQPPFVSNNVYDVLRMHVRKTPPRLGEVDTSRLFPEELERLVARMLAKDPSQRPDDLSIIIDELDRFTNSHYSDAQLQTNSTHIAGSVDDSSPGRNHTPALGLHSTSNAKESETSDVETSNPFRDNQPQSGATIQAFGQRQEADTPAFNRNHTPTTADDRLQAIPGQIHFQGQGDESSAATSIPTAPFSLSVSASKVRATHGCEGNFAIMEAQNPPEVQLFRPDISSPKPLPIPTQSSVCSIAMSKKHLIAGHSDGIISRLDLDTGTSRTLFQDVRRKPVTAVALDSKDRCIIAGSESGRVYMHHTERSTSSDWSRIRGGEAVQSIAINRSADLIAIARKDNSVEVISLSNLRIPTGQFRVNAPVRSMAISPDNYLLAAALVDRSVALFQLPTGHKLLSLQAPNVDVLTVEFSENSKPVAVCAVDSQIRVLEFEEIGEMTRAK